MIIETLGPFYSSHERTAFKSAECAGGFAYGRCWVFLSLLWFLEYSTLTINTQSSCSTLKCEIFDWALSYPTRFVGTVYAAHELSVGRKRLRLDNWIIACYSAPSKLNPRICNPQPEYSFPSVYAWSKVTDCSVSLCCSVGLYNLPAYSMRVVYLSKEHSPRCYL